MALALDYLVAFYGRTQRESALAAGAVMGIMIIPFISSLSDDAIVAVPRALREGSLAMGAVVVGEGA